MSSSCNCDILVSWPFKCTRNSNHPNQMGAYSFLAANYKLSRICYVEVNLFAQEVYKISICFQQ